MKTEEIDLNKALHNALMRTWSQAKRADAVPIKLITADAYELEVFTAYRDLIWSQLKRYRRLVDVRLGESQDDALAIELELLEGIRRLPGLTRLANTILGKHVERLKALKSPQDRLSGIGPPFRALKRFQGHPGLSGPSS